MCRRSFAGIRQILWSKELLSIRTMDSVRRKFYREDDHFPVGAILDFRFVTDYPLHASFHNVTNGFL